MSTFSDLPIELQEAIYRKKYNLELLEGLRNLKEHWGLINPVKGSRHYRFFPRWKRDNYMFDAGSVWFHPDAIKYPELEGNHDAMAIIHKDMRVMCDHPLAWLCFQIHNPDYIVHKK